MQFNCKTSLWTLHRPGTSQLCAVAPPRSRDEGCYVDQDVDSRVFLSQVLSSVRSMDPPYYRRSQPTNAHAASDSAGGLSRPGQHSRHYFILSDEPKTDVFPSGAWMSRSPVGKASPHSSSSSPQSYYTANTSPLSYLTADSTSTMSSNMSFPYSVNSVRSYNSRKNVFYPPRVHWSPLPGEISSEGSVSPEALIWQVRFLCKTLLPHAETRLMPAGRVLLRSLDRDSQRVPVQTDEETRCCSELFIALTHAVLKDGVGAAGLEGPCKRLHTTFKDILSKSGDFSLPTTSKSNEAGLRASSAEILALERFSSVLRALGAVMNAFEGALDSVKPAASKDGAPRDHYRAALEELSVSTGLTIEQYRKKLDQNLTQTHTQLNGFSGKSEGLLQVPSLSSIMPVVYELRGAAKSISTIEERSEAEGEGSSANGHTWSHSAQFAPSHSDGVKRSFTRKILRGLMPSSMGKKS